jgi:hypothetical protein
MPISDKTTELYLQLGIAGAALLILLVCIILLFKFMSDSKKSKNTSDESRIDKLCDKIDALISSNAEHTEKLNEVLLSNDKDQKTTIDHLKQLLVVAIDTQKRVVRIDDRTYACLSKPKED